MYSGSIHGNQNRNQFCLNIRRSVVPYLARLFRHPFFLVLQLSFFAALADILLPLLSPPMLYRGNGKFILNTTHALHSVNSIFTGFPPANAGTPVMPFNLKKPSHIILTHSSRDSRKNKILRTAIGMLKVNGTELPSLSPLPKLEAFSTIALKEVRPHGESLPHTVYRCLSSQIKDSL